MTTNVVPKLLVAIYLLLGAYVLLQIVLLIKQKHKPLSYKAIFSWFSLAWMTLRALFWVLVVAGVTIPSAIFYILFWLPHSIIYMTFATLALFLTKVVARTSWSGVFRRRMMILYGAFGSIDTIGTVTISIMANASNSNNMQNIELAGTGVLFLLLSGVYVYLGLRLRQLQVWDFSRMFMFQPRTISGVTFALAFVFGSRCIWNFVTLTNVVDVSVTDDSAATQSVIFFAYFLWEFLPLILLLSTIAVSPLKNDFQAVSRETLSYGVFGAIEAMNADEEDAAVDVNDNRKVYEGISGGMGTANADEAHDASGLAHANVHLLSADTTGSGSMPAPYSPAATGPYAGGASRATVHSGGPSGPHASMPIVPGGGLGSAGGGLGVGGGLLSQPSSFGFAQPVVRPGMYGTGSVWPGSRVEQLIHDMPEPRSPLFAPDGFGGLRAAASPQTFYLAGQSGHASGSMGGHPGGMLMASGVSALHRSSLYTPASPAQSAGGAHVGSYPGSVPALSPSTSTPVRHMMGDQGVNSPPV